VVVEDVGGALGRHRVHRAERQGDAVVQRLQPEEFVGVLADQVGGPAQHADAFLGPGARPRSLVEGPAGGPYGTVDVVDAGHGELADLLAGRRMRVAPGLPVGRRRPHTVDEELPGGETDGVARCLDRESHDARLFSAVSGLRYSTRTSSTLGVARCTSATRPSRRASAFP
jgi:hypothetical protein